MRASRSQNEPPAAFAGFEAGAGLARDDDVAGFTAGAEMKSSRPQSSAFGAGFVGGGDAAVLGGLFVVVVEVPLPKSQSSSSFEGDTGAAARIEVEPSASRPAHAAFCRLLAACCLSNAARRSASAFAARWAMLIPASLPAPLNVPEPASSPLNASPGPRDGGFEGGADDVPGV